MEASIKFARYLISKQRTKEACDVLMDTYESVMDLPFRHKVIHIHCIPIMTCQLDTRDECHRGVISVNEVSPEICILHSRDSSAVSQAAQSCRCSCVTIHYLYLTSFMSMENRLLTMIAKYYQLEDIDATHSAITKRGTSHHMSCHC